MKRGIMTEPDWRYIAATLANEGDDVQAIFFKAFAKEMRSWGTNYQLGMQLASVRTLLSEDDRELFDHLGCDE